MLFRSRGSEEAVPGPSVFPSGEPGVSGDFWGWQEGCQGTVSPFRSEQGTSLDAESIHSVGPTALTSQAGPGHGLAAKVGQVF